MDRKSMIKVIVDDLRGWMRLDEAGFWEHIHDLERESLRAKTDKELEELYEESK